MHFLPSLTCFTSLPTASLFHLSRSCRLTPFTFPPSVRQSVRRMNSFTATLPAPHSIFFNDLALPVPLTTIWSNHSKVVETLKVDCTLWSSHPFSQNDQLEETISYTDLVKFFQQTFPSTKQHETEAYWSNFQNLLDFIQTSMLKSSLLKLKQRHVELVDIALNRNHAVLCADSTRYLKRFSPLDDTEVREMKIEQLRLNGIVGVHDFERIREQPVIVDIHTRLKPRLPDYSLVPTAQDLADFVDKVRFALINTGQVDKSMTSQVENYNLN